MEHFKKIILFLILLCFFTACVSLPKGFLKPPEVYLEKRQMQMRQYDTKDEKKIITSVAGVLQDLGFTLSESETDLGLVSASRNADAKSPAQITGAVMLDLLSAFLGSQTNATASCDKTQQVKASVVVKPSLDGSKMTVRVTFQRIVWNMSNQISRMETITEQQIYQKFFESLSKAIFLEAQQI
jgi:hypothetical protein